MSNAYKHIASHSQTAECQWLTRAHKSACIKKTVKCAKNTMKLQTWYWLHTPAHSARCKNVNVMHRDAVLGAHVPHCENRFTIFSPNNKLTGKTTSRLVCVHHVTSPTPISRCQKRVVQKHRRWNTRTDAALKMQNPDSSSCLTTLHVCSQHHAQWNAAVAKITELAIPHIFCSSNRMASNYAVCLSQWTQYYTIIHPEIAVQYLEHSRHWK